MRAGGSVIASLLAAATLAGCAADSAIVENVLVVPGYYDTLTCPELSGHVQAAALRVKELTALMEQSAGGPAGPVVNAMAYNTDFAKARATQRVGEDAARRKGCDLTKKVEQKPPDNQPPAAPNVNILLPTSPPGQGR